MKTDVTLPVIPQNIDDDLKRFCMNTLQVIKDLRLETANAMPVHIKYVSADYTIKADDTYTEYQIDNSAADIDITFPELAPVAFRVKVLDDAYNVNCLPATGDTINGTASVLINNFGYCDFSGGESEWKASFGNDSSIVEVSSETADTGLALDGKWDDVDGMVLSGLVSGAKYMLSAKANFTVADTSLVDYLDHYFGLGVTSGNNVPDIDGGYDYAVKIRTGVANTFREFRIPRAIPEFEYFSDGSDIYMKSQIDSDELNVTTHTAYGLTKVPMRIRARRIY